MKAGVALGLALAGLALLLLWYVLPLEDEAAAPAADENPDEAPGRPAPPTAAAPPAVRPAEPAQPDPRAPSARTAANDTPPGDEGEGEAVQEDLPPPPSEPSGPLDELKGAYEADRVDPGAGEAEATIRALSGTELVPAGSLRSVRCSKRVCRVELRWTQEQPLVYMAVAMLMHQKGTTEVAMEPLGELTDEGMDLAVYLSREGYTLEDFQ